MQREYRLFLKDILDATQRIERFSVGITRQQFEADEMRLHAILMNLHIIGEAAKHVPQEVRDTTGNIEWRAIAGLRDIIAHHYFGINTDIIWDVVQHKLPDLQQEITSLLQP